MKYTSGVVPVRKRELTPGIDFFQIVCPICGKKETLPAGTDLFPEHHGTGKGQCGDRFHDFRESD